MKMPNGLLCDINNLQLFSEESPMPARLAQQDNENRMMEGRVPTSPIVRHHEQGVGGPPPSNLSPFVHCSCRSQPHGKDILRSYPMPVGLARQTAKKREGIAKYRYRPKSPRLPTLFEPVPCPLLFPGVPSLSLPRGNRPPAFSRLILSYS